MRAFVVGISKYEYLSALKNAVNDAKAMVKYLQSHGVKEEDILCCFDCHSFQLFAAFKKFVALCRPGDFVIIFFAGNACTFKNMQCLLARGLTKDEKLTLNNNEGQLILESSLQVDKMLTILRCKGITKHLVLLDCSCEFRVEDMPRGGTGTATAGGIDVTNVLEDSDKTVSNVHFGYGQGTVIGYASSPGDRASDGFRGTSGHGKTIHK